MDTNYHNWLEFLKAIAPDLTVLQQAPDGNPLLWAQIAGERVRIIQEADSKSLFGNSSIGCGRQILFYTALNFFKIAAGYLCKIDYVELTFRLV